jgi:hypothetical protein
LPLAIFYDVGAGRPDRSHKEKGKKSARETNVLS